MNDDLRKGLAGDAARRFVREILPGRVEAIDDHPDGGWSLHVTEIDRYATEVIEDQDLFYDHFCEITTDNEADDAADVVECLLTGLTPKDGECGILLECEWRRRVGLGSRAGSVEGRLVIVPPHLWDDTLRRMEHDHAQRSLEWTVQEAGYVAASIRAAISTAHRPLELGDLRKFVGDMMRVLMEVEERNAVHAPA